jgi:chromosome segregation ATPase
MLRSENESLKNREEKLRVELEKSNDELSSLKEMVNGGGGGSGGGSGGSGGPAAAASAGDSKDGDNSHPPSLAERMDAIMKKAKVFDELLDTLKHTKVAGSPVGTIGNDGDPVHYVASIIAQQEGIEKHMEQVGLGEKGLSKRGLNQKEEEKKKKDDLSEVTDYSDSDDDEGMVEDGSDSSSSSRDGEESGDSHPEGSVVHKLIQLKKVTANLKKRYMKSRGKRKQQAIEATAAAAAAATAAIEATAATAAAAAVTSEMEETHQSVVEKIKHDHGQEKKSLAAEHLVIIQKVRDEQEKMNDDYLTKIESLDFKTKQLERSLSAAEKELELRTNELGTSTIDFKQKENRVIQLNKELDVCRADNAANQERVERLKISTHELEENNNELEERFSKSEKLLKKMEERMRKVEEEKSVSEEDHRKELKRVSEERKCWKVEMEEEKRKREKEGDETKFESERLELELKRVREQAGKVGKDYENITRESNERQEKLQEKMSRIEESLRAIKEEKETEELSL